MRVFVRDLTDRLSVINLLTDVAISSKFIKTNFQVHLCSYLGAFASLWSTSKIRSLPRCTTPVGICPSISLHNNGVQSHRLLLHLLPKALGCNDIDAFSRRCTVHGLRMTARLALHRCLHTLPAYWSGSTCVSQVLLRGFKFVARATACANSTTRCPGTIPIPTGDSWIAVANASAFACKLPWVLRTSGSNPIPTVAKSDHWQSHLS